MSKIMSFFVPVEVHLHENGNVAVFVYPGDIDQVLSQNDAGHFVQDEDGFDILDSITWDNPRTWEAC